MSKPSLPPASGHHQRGMILLVVLVLTLAVTMLMLIAMGSAKTDTRMAANARDWALAFQAAEAALRDGEREIMAATRISGVSGFADGCSDDGLCLVSTSDVPVWERLESNAGWARGQEEGPSVRYGQFTSSPPFGGVAAQPRYIVEALPAPPSGSIRRGLGPANSRFYYRVTAVGFGQSTATRVVLQAVYKQH